MTTKICTICKKEKGFKFFHKDKNNKTGYRSICKVCRRDSNRTKVGRIKHIYRKQITSSKVRKHNAPDYTLGELIEWCLQQESYHTLFALWENNEFDNKLTPTCDRVLDSKPYTLDNLQLLTWDTNKLKGEADRKAGKSATVQMRKVAQLSSKRNTVIKEYTSVAIAAREVGTCTSNICACCNGKRETCRGYKWKYVT